MIWIIVYLILGLIYAGYVHVKTDGESYIDDVLGYGTIWPLWIFTEITVMRDVRKQIVTRNFDPVQCKCGAWLPMSDQDCSICRAIK